MAATLDTVRIQNKLVDLGKAGPFYRATYDGAGKKVVDETTAIVPVTVLANEVAATFDMSPVNKRDYVLDRQTWSWLLKLSFSCEVTGEAFESALMDNPPILAKDTAHKRQVILKLVRLTPKHPPTQDPGQGSQLDYAFEVQSTPQ